MYATRYAEVIDAKSIIPADYDKLLKQIPDEVIREDWQKRYKAIRDKFPRNYLTTRTRQCPNCHTPLGARQMRKHRCNVPDVAV